MTLHLHKFCHNLRVVFVPLQRVELIEDLLVLRVITDVKYEVEGLILCTKFYHAF